MTKELTELLTQLCDKLGIAVEHLWGVLVKQARIAAIADFIFILFFCAAYVYLWKFISKKTKRIKKSEYHEEAEWDEEGAFFAWFGMAVLGGVGALYLYFSGSGIMTAIFNPEYWAFKQIVK